MRIARLDVEERLTVDCLANLRLPRARIGLSSR